MIKKGKWVNPTIAAVSFAMIAAFIISQKFVQPAMPFFSIVVAVVSVVVLAMAIASVDPAICEESLGVVATAEEGRILSVLAGFLFD